MPVTMLILLRHLELALRLHAAVPELPMAEAYAHAAAADAAATPSVPAELLLAVAYVETGYDPTSTSRVENGVRCMGHYPSTRPPADLSPRTSLFCGPLQTQAYSWGHCLAMRRLSVAYTTGAREIGTWLEDRRVRGNVVRALAGYGCGNFGVQTGRCNYYPQRVLYMERKIEHARPRPEVAQAQAAIPRS